MKINRIAICECEWTENACLGRTLNRYRIVYNSKVRYCFFFFLHEYGLHKKIFSFLLKLVRDRIDSLESLSHHIFA